MRVATATVAEKIDQCCKQYFGIDQALTAKFSILVILVLGILKVVATSFTIGSGGSGGIFAPSLYIGTMFGLFLGWVILGFPSVSGSGDVLLPFAIGGMAALFAGAARAPLTAMFQIPEMTHSFHLFPSVALICTLSFVVSTLLLRGSSIYTMKLERRGERVKSAKVRYKPRLGACSSCGRDLPSTLSSSGNAGSREGIGPYFCRWRRPIGWATD